MNAAEVKAKVCFLGGARYSKPLDAVTQKKFQALAGLAEMFVVGFSQDVRPRRFKQHARFYLLPKFPLSLLRYVATFVAGSALAVWVVVHHRVRVLVAQSPYEGFAAALAKRIAGFLGWRVAVIVESHGDFEDSLFLQRRIWFSGIYRMFMRRIATFALREADLLRSVSCSTREQLRQWAPSKPLVQFMTWTDLEAFWQAGEARTGATGCSILYAGVITPLKGIHHLIAAFARIADGFPETSLAVVGRWENAEYARRIAREVERLGLNGRVRFIGEIPHRQLARWMAGSLVLVLPSLSEGLARVVVEAMACGTPVIGSRVGGIPEVVEDGVTGFLVPPGDEDALADRLRWVLANPEASRAMGQQARAFASRFFSTEEYVKGYRRLFAMAEDVLQGRPPDHAPAPF